MALTIEDGSIVANANSFVTVADFDNYLTARGITLYSSGDTAMTEAEKEAELVKAYSYMASTDSMYGGERVNKDQTGAYPRYNVCIDGFSYTSTEIPQTVKNVQMEYAIDGGQGIDIYTGSTAIKSESVSIGNGAVQESKEYLGGQVLEMRQSRILVRKLYGGGSFGIPLVR